VIVPLQVYLFCALDAVYANLTSDTSLPPNRFAVTPSWIRNQFACPGFAECQPTALLG
jgi:hypothetical protein